MTFHSVSQLVTLDVTVLDRAGHPVTDLSSNDFQIYESGTKRPINSFEPFNEHLLPQALSKDSIHGIEDVQHLLPGAPLEMIVLDELNTAFSDTAFARNSIKKYLLHQPERLAAPTSFLVCTDTGFQQIHGFTLSRQELLDALSHLPAAYPFQLMRTGGSGEGRSVRFAQTLASLQQIAQANTGHHGRTNVLWIGRGFQSIDLRDMTNTEIRMLKNAAERTINLLREANAVLYTIDPALTSSIAGASGQIGKEDSDAFTAEVSNARDPFESTISFNSIAPQTGGTTISMNNAIDEEIENSLHRGLLYYSLSFVPSPIADPEHPYRGITVKVNRPGVQVITRKGYYAISSPPPAHTVRENLRAAGFDIGTAITSRISFTGLGMLAGRYGSDQYLLQVNTGDIDWEAETDGTATAHLLAVAVALDAKGKPLDKAVQEINARVPPDKSPDSIPFTTIHITLAVPKAAETIRIVVRDMRTGRMGSAGFNVSEDQGPAMQTKNNKSRKQ